MTWKIRTPVEDYTGPGPAGLHFVNGEATTDDLAAYRYCTSAGYTVERVDETATDPANEQSEKDTPPEPKTDGSASEADKPSGGRRGGTKTS